MMKMLRWLLQCHPEANLVLSQVSLSTARLNRRLPMKTRNIGRTGSYSVQNTMNSFKTSASTGTQVILSLRITSRRITTSSFMDTFAPKSMSKTSLSQILLMSLFLFQTRNRLMSLNWECSNLQQLAISPLVKEDQISWCFPLSSTCLNLISIRMKDALNGFWMRCATSNLSMSCCFNALQKKWDLLFKDLFTVHFLSSIHMRRKESWITGLILRTRHWIQQRSVTLPLWWSKISTLLKNSHHIAPSTFR